MADIVRVRRLSESATLVFVGSEHIDQLRIYFEKQNIPCVEVQGVERSAVPANLDRCAKVDISFAAIPEKIGEWALTAR